MAELGLDMLDRSIQDTNRWLNTIGEELGPRDKQTAYQALRAVLFTLRDRIPTDLAVNFGAQLPVLVRGIFYEGYDPNDTPHLYRTRAEWNERVEQAQDETGTPLNPEQMTRAVFTCLNDELNEGILEKVFTALPEDVRTLWPDLKEAAMHA
ncbi:MAG: DUF2267 domain-containing protein [Bacteroidetes bacterium]|jgi:uncharacterized protein (DUF2267 family)|nr:DUF2267 domain-containing protein [Bacteroidota bacterium]